MCDFLMKSLTHLETEAVGRSKRAAQEKSWEYETIGRTLAECRTGEHTYRRTWGSEIRYRSNSWHGLSSTVKWKTKRDDRHLVSRSKSIPQDVTALSVDQLRKAHAAEVQRLASLNERLHWIPM